MMRDTTDKTTAETSELAPAPRRVADEGAGAHEDRQEAMRQEIEASPVVAACGECGGEIRQAEVDFGLATGRECAPCVRDYVLDTIGDW